LSSLTRRKTAYVRHFFPAIALFNDCCVDPDWEPYIDVE
jgi:hypothetical protein